MNAHSAVPESDRGVLVDAYEALRPGSDASREQICSASVVVRSGVASWVRARRGAEAVRPSMTADVPRSSSMTTEPILPMALPGDLVARAGSILVSMVLTNLQQEMRS